MGGQSNVMISAMVRREMKAEEKGNPEGER